MRIRFEFFIALGCFAILVGLTFAHESLRRARAPSTHSSFDRGEHGYRALYELLRREGIVVTRNTHRHAHLLGTRGTLVMAIAPYEYADGAAGLAPAELQAVRDYVREGGEAVILAPPYGSDVDHSFGIPNSVERDGAPRHAATIARRFSGIGAIEGDFATVFPFAAKLRAVPDAATGAGIVAMEYSLGRGRMIVLTDPDVFSNRHLGNAQNARFAVALFAQSPAPVAFDETLHGYMRSSGAWAALPIPVRIAIALAGFAIALTVVGQALREAPPVSLRRTKDPDSAAYIAALAGLYRRAGATATALRLLTNEAMRDTAVAVVRTDSATDLEARAELSRLRQLVQPSRADLVRAAHLSGQMREG